MSIQIEKISDIIEKEKRDCFEILGVKIDAVNLTLASERILQWIKEKRKTYVCVAPVSTVMDCQRDAGYRDIVNSAGMVTPDGMPVVWIGKWKKHSHIERTYGPDLIKTMCRLSEREGCRHYFYGGSEATCRRLAEKLQRQFPRLQIAGQYSPPFRDIHGRETQEVIDRINAGNPDILWVGLGAPKQDYWMFYHRDKLDVPVMIGVGAAFDFLAGTKVQAPVWIQRSGFEWLFRLCCEPKRLWRRYLFGNSQFVYLLLKDFLKLEKRINL